MPAGFERCVAAGGRVRTKKLKGKKYIHICFKGGKSYSGEVKTAKKPKGKLEGALKRANKR